MTTEEHFWIVKIEGETAGDYGPFAMLEAASEFAQAHQHRYPSFAVAS